MERGLYRASDGRYINADINGSGNIIHKVAPNAFPKVEGVEDGKAVLVSVVVHPVRIAVPVRNQKSKRKVAKASVNSIQDFATKRDASLELSQSR